MEYLLTFFFLVSAHYFRYENLLPWKLPHPMRIIANYVIGTVGMLAPFAYWLWSTGNQEAVYKLIGFVIAAGLAPVLSYLNDYVISIRQRANEAEERETHLLSNRHAKD